MTALATTSLGPLTTCKAAAGIFSRASLASAAAAAKISAKRRAAPGACGGGLTITLAPTARAGATLCATRFSGKLNGAMARIGPRGVQWLTAGE